MELETTTKLENLALLFDGSVSALSAVHTAMTEGDFAPSDFFPALFFIWSVQTDLSKQLQQIIYGEEASA